MSIREPIENRSMNTFFRAGAVAILYNKDTRLVLAGKRIAFPSGTWQFPQGGIEDGQTPLDAALDEVLEETGIMLTPDDLLYSFAQWTVYEFKDTTAFHGRGQAHKWYVFAFSGEAKLRDPVDQEFSELAWMAFDDVMAQTADFRKPAYHMIRDEFVARSMQNNWAQNDN